MQHGQSTGAAFVPLSFAPGEAYQFDWSHEVVLLDGGYGDGEGRARPALPQRILHVRSLSARDAGDGVRCPRPGVCAVQGHGGRGIYDNMKTAVETVFVGKNRLYNRLCLQMYSHYLAEPLACTPASRWEKGQVENEVGLMREQFFTPRLRFKSYDELKP